jgi:hypothetical protein
MSAIHIPHKPDEKYLVFRAHKGFAVYIPDHGVVVYTQSIQEATEATRADWLDVIPFDDQRDTFIPAVSYVVMLELKRGAKP